MPVLAQIAIALGSIGVLLALMAGLKHIAERQEWPAEVQRKLVHIWTGLYTLSFPWLFPEGWPVYLLVAVTLIVLLVLRLPMIARHGIGTTLHGVERQSYGDFLLTASVGLTFFLSGGEWVLYVLPMAVLTLADAAAALAGTAYGKRVFVVEEGTKSAEGAVVFFLVTLVVSMCCLLLLTEVPRENVIALSLAVAAIGTLIEAESWRGLDNLFLPVGLMLYLESNLAAPLPWLAAELVFLAAVILLSNAAARRMRLVHHTVRVYVVVGFLILTVVDVQNAVLPLIALGAHAFASRHAPCTAPYPHLDMAAVLVFVSVGWLAAGTAMQIDALLFYQTTLAAMSVGFAAIALRASGPGLRIVALVGTAIILSAAVFVLIRLNPEPVLWSGAEAYLPILACLVAAALVALVPGLFQRIRAVKIAGLSGSLSLAAYALLIATSGGVQNG